MKSQVEFLNEVFESRSTYLKKNKKISDFFRRNDPFDGILAIAEYGSDELRGIIAREQHSYVPDSLKSLLETGLDFKEVLRRSKNLKAIKFLAKLTDSEDRIFIYHAAANKDYEMIRDVKNFFSKFDKGRNGSYFLGICGIENDRGESALSFAVSDAKLAQLMASELLIREIASRGKIDEEILRLVLATKVDINARDSSEKNAIDYLLIRSLEEDDDYWKRDLDLLIKHGAKILDSSTVGYVFNVLISKGDNVSLKFLLERGLNPNCLVCENYNLLFFALQNNNSEIATALINHGADPLRISANNLPTLFGIFAFDDKEALLSKIISDPQDRKNFVKLSKAAMIVGLYYSDQSYDILSTASKDKFASVIAEEVASSNLQEDDKNLLCRAIDAIGSSKKFPIDGGYSRVICTKYINHQAYFVINYDSKNNPKLISYCDGNMVFGHQYRYRANNNTYEKFGFAVTSFAVDQNKIRDLDDFESALSNSISESGIYNPSINPDFDLLAFNRAISPFVFCDQNNNPIIFFADIASKLQDRGNCVGKSFNCALQFVLKNMKPQEMNSGVDQFGNIYGTLHDFYKKFKNTIIKKEIETICEFSMPNRYGSFCYKDSINILENTILPKAISKGHQEVYDRVHKLLEAKAVIEKFSSDEKFPKSSVKQTGVSNVKQNQNPSQMSI